jgi:hypothetical protein
VVLDAVEEYRSMTPREELGHPLDGICGGITF